MAATGMGEPEVEDESPVVGCLCTCECASVCGECEDIGGHSHSP